MAYRSSSLFEFTETIVHYQTGKVQTHDGASLDTLEVKPKLKKGKSRPHENEQRYIIHLGGNGQSFDGSVCEMQRYADETGYNQVGFNFRGVGGSTGNTCSQNDMIVDIMSQVERLIKKGVKAEHILLKGHSLGSAAATLAAAKLHALGMQVCVFNGRSFSSLTNEVVGLIRTGLSGEGEATSLTLKALGWLLKPFIYLTLSLNNWEMDVQTAYRRIPDEKKSYLVVRSPKAPQNNIAARSERFDDGVIPHYASLHAALKTQRSAEKIALDTAIQLARTTPGNAGELSKLEAKRAEFKQHKFQIQKDEVSDNYKGIKDHNFTFDFSVRKPKLVVNH